MTELDDQIAGLSPVQRELLSRWLADGNTRSAEYAPAGTDDERALVDIWQQVLEVDQIGIDDDYFELGGDSVHAIVIAARAQQIGLDLGTQDLLDGRTVRTVAGLATAASAAPAPVPAATEHKLTPLQQGMLYHAVGGSTPGAYLVQLRCRLVGDLDRDAFRTAWHAVFAANPVLRTVVRWAGRDRPTQAFVPGMTMPVELVDLEDLSPGVRAAAAARLLDDDRARGFDLEHGPLMRLTLVVEGPSRHWCVWTYHHIVMDGWSQQLVLRDVVECYRRLRDGGPASPRDRPSFEGYLGWLDQRTDPGDAFWRRRLAGLDGATRLAGPGCVDGQVVTAARPQEELALPEGLWIDLLAFSRQHGVTVGAVVHAGWALLLAARTGRDDVLHGATVSGRPPELPGIADTVGMFINTLPLRVRCAPSAVVVDWLHDVQSRLAELREWQHVGLSRIERAVGLGYGGGLFDSIVVVENFPTWVRGGDEVAGLRIDDVAVVVEEGYPLVLEFAPGGDATMRARYDERRIDRTAVVAGLHALVTYLEAVLGHGEPTVGELRAQLAAAWSARVEHERRTARARAERGLGMASRRATAAAPEPGGQR